MDEEQMNIPELDPPFDGQEKENTDASETEPLTTTNAETAGGSGTKKGAKENLYDKIPLTVNQLNVIIILLAVAFVVFLVLGALVGNGVIEGPIPRM